MLHLNSGRAIALSYGTRLPVLRVDSAGMAVVRSPDGFGTIANAALAPALHPSGASIVRQAKRFVGLRYLWGGLSAWGFDCSGLVWDVFRVHGMTIPRDADPQFRHGTPVARSALRPGDLVFYGTQSYVHHVAIYAGNGLMVEAPDSAHSVRVVPLRCLRLCRGSALPQRLASVASISSSLRITSASEGFGFGVALNTPSGSSVTFSVSSSSSPCRRSPSTSSLV